MSQNHTITISARTNGRAAFIVRLRAVGGVLEYRYADTLADARATAQWIRTWDNGRYASAPIMEPFDSAFA